MKKFTKKPIIEKRTSASATVFLLLLVVDADEEELDDISEKCRRIDRFHYENKQQFYNRFRQLTYRKNLLNE